jgi:hypothetical protein
MRVIGRALAELLGVVAAGFVGFFVMLAYAAGLLALLACGVACAGFLLVALFSMVMWLLTRDGHAFWLMIGYFGYAGGTFAVIVTLTYYHGKLMDGVTSVRARRDALRRIGQLRLKEDAAFEA